MTKKNWLQVLLAIVLFAVYAVYFTDWFKTKTIGIFHTYRNLHPGMARGNAMPSLIFVLNREMSLDEINVVPFGAYQTNRYVLPLWHLATDSNSLPVKLFFYGQNVRGMRLAVKGIRAEPLETNVPYLLIVRSGKIKGEHEFELK